MAEPLLAPPASAYRPRRSRRTGHLQPLLHSMTTSCSRALSWRARRWGSMQATASRATASTTTWSVSTPCSAWTSAAKGHASPASPTVSGEAEELHLPLSGSAVAQLSALAGLPLRVALCLAGPREAARRSSGTQSAIRLVVAGGCGRRRARGSGTGGGRAPVTVAGSETMRAQTVPCGKACQRSAPGTTSTVQPKVNDPPNAKPETTNVWRPGGRPRATPR